MVIRTVLLLSLEHKLKPKYASVKNRISVKFINVNKKNTSIQDIIKFQISRAGLPYPARVLTNQIACLNVVTV